MIQIPLLVTRNHFFGYWRNSEAFSSELQEYIEYIFSQYYMHSDIFSMFKYSTTQYCVTRREQLLNVSIWRKQCLKISNQSLDLSEIVRFGFVLIIKFNEAWKLQTTTYEWFRLYWRLVMRQINYRIKFVHTTSIQSQETLILYVLV